MSAQHELTVTCICYETVPRRILHRHWSRLHKDVSLLPPASLLTPERHPSGDLPHPFDDALDSVGMDIDPVPPRPNWDSPDPEPEPDRPTPADLMIPNAGSVLTYASALTKQDYPPLSASNTIIRARKLETSCVSRDNRIPTIPFITSVNTSLQKPSLCLKSRRRATSSK